MTINEEIDDICCQYDLFLEEAMQNSSSLKKWLKTDNIRVYLTKYVSYKGPSSPRLVIGSIEFDKTFQKQGALPKILTYFEANLACFVAIEVENITNPRLSECLKTGGYVLSPFRYESEFIGTDQRAKVFDLEKAMGQYVIKKD